MSKKTKLKPQNEYQIHKGKVSEPKSGSESKHIEDLGHIETHELKEYDGLNVTDITDGDEYSFQPFDSGNRLVQTENGEFLIVHSRVVNTGAWSFAGE
jgi:hypothetical protein